ncbi:MAG: ASPIC/UnbV domain-containing protein, partial [Phycisphaerales bacterium JB059]
ANQHSYVFAMGDVDLDGDQDLVTSPTGQNHRLYNNNASNGNWVKFRVVGQGANGFGVGTVIDVHAAGVWQCRELQMGNNFKAQNDHLQHFGLAAATHMDEIVVAWPGGDTRTLTGYAANETWTLYPPERMGDVNNDGRIDAYDITRALDAMRSPFKPGDEIFDMDGNGHLTIADISLMGLEVSDRFQRGLRAGP